MKTSLAYLFLLCVGMFLLLGSSYQRGNQVILTKTGGGTLSYVQNGNCTPGGSSTSCSITMSVGSLTAGNLYVLMGFVKNAAVTVTSMVAGGQTYTAGSTLQLAYGCSDGWYNNLDVPLCYYVLPSNSLGGTSPVTINYSTITNTGSRFYLVEVSPSANGSQVGLSNDAMQYQPTAGTTLNGPTVTTSGTSPFTITGNAPDSGGPSSAAGAPYNTHNLFSGNFGFAQAASASPASWTLTSGTIYANALVFSFNPKAFSQGFAMNWSGATSGTTITPANAAASMQGWQGCQWVDSGGGGTTISSAGAQTVLSSFGPLNDGSTLSAGTSLNGYTITSNGSNTDGWTCSLANGYATQISLYPAPFSFGTWYKLNNSCSVSYNYDIAELSSYNSSSTGDYLSETSSGGGAACVLAIETQTFTSSRVRNIVILPNEWYWVDYFFDGRQITVTFTNASPVISGTNTYTAGQLINFTTTGALPTNFSTGLSYYVCSTGLSSSQFEVAATSGCASPISAGSAGSGTQAAVNVHTGKAYNATTLTGATCTSGTTTITTAGLPADANVVNGITVYIENVTPSSWNGTFTGITVSGNNISYSQTCPGSAYSSGGAIVAQVGGTQDASARGGNQYYFNINIGPMRETQTSGATATFGYSKMSFAGTDPLLP